MQPWTDVCVIPRTFIQPILMVTIVNFIFHFFVGDKYPRHDHMIQYCIQHKFRYHFPNVEVLKYKPVPFLPLIHLISMASTLSLSSIKFNSNMANNFNTEVVRLCFGFIIFVVCYIMVIKENHWILSFILVGQYKSLSWRSIYFFKKV